MKNRDFIDSRRIELTGKILLGIMFILAVRLWQIQILRGSEFRELSQKNTIRPLRVEGIRGDILDRNGEMLAENRPGFNARIFRSGRESVSMENWDYVFSRLDVDKTLRDFPLKRYGYLKKDVDWETVAWLSERKAYLPELSIEVYPRRCYPLGESLAHVIGYIGEISSRELEELRDQDYAPGDSTGKAGIERSMERFLRGSSGGKQVLVNAYGHHIDVLAEKKPAKGHNVRLTIDSRLQRIVEDELGESPGAVVVMDPRNGEVLAIASRPAFDPNILSGRISRDQWREFLLSGPVFESKAFQSGYPPGSTFKPVVAAAALEGGFGGGGDAVYCPGEYRLGSHVFRCWYREGHGLMEIGEALVYSCNVYFYKQGSRAGIGSIANHAHKLGFGRVSGIEVPGESPGLFPTPEWKRARFGLPWYPGDTVNVSIGQGYVLATPLQVAVMYSAIANGGILHPPRVVRSVEDSSGRIVREGFSGTGVSLGLSPGTVNTIRTALEEAVSRGTGLNARVNGLRVSGKTGTSQNPHGENHAWFAGYAPSEEPVICMVVMLEHAGQGSHAAAPVFRNILERAFSLR